MHRAGKLIGQLNTSGTLSSAQNGSDLKREDLRGAYQALWELVDTINCNPILIRLAWHDAGTFDKNIGTWPEQGGANGSIRFPQELAHGANAGLSKAVGYLKPIKQRFPSVSWADLIQLGSKVAVEHSSGYLVPMRFGRRETLHENQCPKEGNLPAAEPPFPNGAKDAAQHLRDVFYRMDFDDREIVALSGAHSVGRAFKERSGTVPEGYGDANATKWTHSSAIARKDGASGIGMPGGRSWTSKWLKMDNEYFHRESAEDPKKKIWYSTDNAVSSDPSFKSHFQRYKADNQVFMKEFIDALIKLSERGALFD